MTTQEVANTLVKLCSEGKFHEAVETLYSDDIVSMEAGAPPGGRVSRRVWRLSRLRANGGPLTTKSTRRVSRVRSWQVRILPSLSSWTSRLSLKPNGSRWKRWPSTKLPMARSYTKSFSTTCRTTVRDAKSASKPAMLVSRAL